MAEFIWNSYGNNTKKPLEQRFDELTTTVEKMQTMLNQFITLYESEKLANLSQQKSDEKKKIPKDCGKLKMQQKITELQMEIDRLTGLHVLDKLKWDEERQKLQKDLEYYKSLSQKSSTVQSSNQSLQESAEPTEEISKSVYPLRDFKTLHMCYKCYKLFNIKGSLYNYQESKFDGIPMYTCLSCKDKFMHQDYFKKHSTLGHTISPSRVVHERLAKIETEKKAAVEKNTQQQSISQTISEYKKCATWEETDLDVDYTDRTFKDIQNVPEKVQLSSVISSKIESKEKEVQQKADEPIVGQYEAFDVDETIKTFEETLNLSEVGRQSNKSVPTITITDYVFGVPVKLAINETIDEETRMQLRQTFILKLLVHPCQDSECTIGLFRTYMEHELGCKDGEECSWYICKSMWAMTNHSKTCKQKAKCLTCRPYIQFNETKVPRLWVILEDGCPLNSDHLFGVNPCDMTKSTRETTATMVTRIAVNYGLIGHNVKVFEEKMFQLENETSLSGESSTTEEWEVVENERRREVD